MKRHPSKIHAAISHHSDFLVSALAVYTTALEDHVSLHQSIMFAQAFHPGCCSLGNLQPHILKWDGVGIMKRQVATRASGGRRLDYERLHRFVLRKHATRHYVLDFLSIRELFD